MTVALLQHSCTGSVPTCKNWFECRKRKKVLVVLQMATRWQQVTLKSASTNFTEWDQNHLREKKRSYLWPQGSLWAFGCCSCHLQDVRVALGLHDVYETTEGTCVWAQTFNWKKKTKDQTNSNTPYPPRSISSSVGSPSASCASCSWSLSRPTSRSALALTMLSSV